ncbi:DUF5694 domain-containing protein [Salimicrobium sp. PL1-032A]|uniref:DUF5694 domain-containing protein n=1 Tax=Salimicrobium sp. PL1-032A TaxID=3095364 RepID=UPI0032608A06
MSRLLLIGTPNFAVQSQLIEEAALSELAISFASFEPTLIAIEKNYYVEEEVNRQLKAYRDNESTLLYDALEQFAFRTASKTDIPTLTMVDEIVDMSNPSLDQVFTWAEEYQPELLKEIISIKRQADQWRDASSLTAYMTRINDPGYIDLLQQLHASLNIVGDRHHQIGSSWLKQWYEKNLSVAANIERLGNQKERMLVFVSEESLPILTDLLAQSGRITLEASSSYLT